MAFLKELSIALGLLTSDNAAVADAGGWQNFVWRTAPMACKAPDEEGFCPVVSNRWDWNRPQTYHFAYRHDLSTSSIIARVRLENRDLTNSDNVCIVAVIADRDGRELAVFYANFRSLHGRTIERQFPIFPPFPLALADQIAVGSKHCEKVNKTDNAAFREMRRRVAP